MTFGLAFGSTQNAFAGTSLPCQLSAINVGDYVILGVSTADVQTVGSVTVGDGITCLSLLATDASQTNLYVFAGFADSALAAKSGGILDVNCSDGFVWSNFCAAISNVDPVTPWLTGPSVQANLSTSYVGTSQAVAGGGSFLVLVRMLVSSGGGFNGGTVTAEATTADGALTVGVNQESFFGSGDGPIGFLYQNSVTNPTGTMTGTISASDPWLTVAGTLRPAGGGGGGGVSPYSVQVGTNVALGDGVRICA